MIEERAELELYWEDLREKWMAPYSILLHREAFYYTSVKKDLYIDSFIFTCFHTRTEMLRGFWFTDQYSFLGNSFVEA